MPDLIEDGYTVLPGVFDETKLQTILKAIEDGEARQIPSRKPSRFEGQSTSRVYNMLAKNEAFWMPPQNERVLAVVRQLLGPEVLLSSLSSIALEPGESEQPFHADDECYPLEKPHGPIECVAMVAITDFTVSNGATRVVPGTHRLNSHPDWRSEWKTEAVDAIAVEMTAGDVLMYQGSLWHSAGANRSNSRRVGLAMCYCVPWIRGHENLLLGTPSATLRQLPPLLKNLIGLTIVNGSINHVEGISPAQFVDSLGWPSGMPE